MITEECFMEFCETNKINKQVAKDFLERSKSDDTSSVIRRTAPTRKRINEDYNRSSQSEMIWGITGDLYFPL